MMQFKRIMIASVLCMVTYQSSCNQGTGVLNLSQYDILVQTQDDNGLWGPSISSSGPVTNSSGLGGYANVGPGWWTPTIFGLGQYSCSYLPGTYWCQAGKYSSFNTANYTLNIKVTGGNFANCVYQYQSSSTDGKIVVWTGDQFQANQGFLPVPGTQNELQFIPQPCTSIATCNNNSQGKGSIQPSWGQSSAANSTQLDNDSTGQPITGANAKSSSGNPCSQMFVTTPQQSTTSPTTS